MMLLTAAVSTSPPTGSLAEACAVAAVTLEVREPYWDSTTPEISVPMFTCVSALSSPVAVTVTVALGVGVGVTLLGVGSAWLVTRHEFPGRRVFEWALVLPLAMPAYVMAYTYTDLLQYVGPVQTALREAFHWKRADYGFPDVRSTGGAVLMFSIVLYPYVYMLARTAFIERAGGSVKGKI
mgnify:CR=1 FL=1